jgi:hypothetical protein
MKIKTGLIILALCLLLGPALADPGVPQMEESQGFTTLTDMQTLGTVTETDSLAWRIKSDGFRDPYGGLDNNQLYSYNAAEYSMTYSEATIADQGLVSYTKQGSVDTQAKAEGQQNVDMQKVVEFVGLDTGRMVSDEEQVLDGAGTPFTLSNTFICPFALDTSEYLPAFCNIVQEGSAVDITLGSLATQAEDRFVTPVQSRAGWDLPISDSGVESGYQVRLTGFGDLPALGSADAYMNVHVQEGRGLLPYDELKAEDLVFSEDTTASGDITLFQKVMNYDSKLTGSTLNRAA